MRMLFWPVFILLTFINEATAGDVATPKIEHLEGGYSVELPASLSIAPGNPMPDFVLYKVNSPAGKQLLAIYLGCAPDTRFKPPANAIREHQRN